jgi:TRAP-type C4-dicarboxylate transport system permease small subunit
MEIDQSLELKTDTLFDRAVLFTATGLFTLTIALTTLQVFIRWLELPTFGFLHWTEPAARFVLIVATYIGAAVALRNNEHISIRFLLERLKGWNATVGKAVSVLGDLIVIGFLGIALIGTIETTAADWTTSIGGIGVVTSGHLYLGIATGITLMLVYAVIDLVGVFKDIVTETSSTANGEVSHGDVGK